MRISCLRENLAKALGSLSRTVTPSSTLPILANVLIKTDQGRLKLSATDLEMGINYWIGADVTEEGEITIPARIFGDYVNNNNDEKIGLLAEGQLVTVLSDHYNTKINGLLAEEFPIIPLIKENERLNVMTDVLGDATSKVVFAAASGESNPALSGVLFKAEGDVLKIVATDSYRLAEKVIKLEKEVAETFSVIVPTKTVAELNKILGSSDKQTVKIFISDNQIMFRLDHVEVVSRLIEGNYPAYESIMPTAFVTKALVEAKDLLRDARMASVFSRETQKIKLMIDKENNSLMTLSKGQSGENVSKLPIEADGVNGEITFNNKYLLDVLNVLGQVKISIELTDKLKPGLIRPANDDGYRYIIMPLKD